MVILKKPKLVATEFTCQACKCVYLAEYGEYSVNSDNYSHIYNGTYKRCHCPICGTVNFVIEDAVYDPLDQP